MSREEIKWTLLDYTNKKDKGYIVITCDGVRVADAFPYAKDADPDFVRRHIKLIVDTMNTQSNQEPPK